MSEVFKKLPIPKPKKDFNSAIKENQKYFNLLGNHSTINYLSNSELTSNKDCSEKLIKLEEDKLIEPIPAEEIFKEKLQIVKTGKKRLVSLESKLKEKKQNTKPNQDLVQFNIKPLNDNEKNLPRREVQNIHKEEVLPESRNVNFISVDKMSFKEKLRNFSVEKNFEEKKENILLPTIISPIPKPKKKKNNNYSFDIQKEIESNSNQNQNSRNQFRPFMQEIGKEIAKSSFKSLKIDDTHI